MATVFLHVVFRYMFFTAWFGIKAYAVCSGLRVYCRLRDAWEIASKIGTQAAFGRLANLGMNLLEIEFGKSVCHLLWFHATITSKYSHCCGFSLFVLAVDGELNVAVLVISNWLQCTFLFFPLFCDVQPSGATDRFKILLKWRPWSRFW